jgi:thiaminase
MFKNMATEIGDNVQVKANLAFMAKVIAIVGTCVWGYSVVWNKLMVLDSSLDRVQHEGTLLGDLSARMMHIEKFAEQSKVDLDHLLEMQDSPITSDFQQFEIIKYLEKELDRLRDKLENHLMKGQ